MSRDVAVDREIIMVLGVFMCCVTNSSLTPC